MHDQLDRRGLLGTLAKGAAVAGLSQLGATSASAAQTGTANGGAASPVGAGFHYCLNTSTIRGQKLSLPAEIEIAAKAGYHAVEPWIGEIDAYVKDGGSLKDLGKLIADAGLTVESLIAFPEWILDDVERRTKGLEEAKRCLDIAAQIGGKRIAAPAAGAKEVTNLSLSVVAERYRAVLELGDSFGVVPQVEFWGHSQTLSRLGEAIFVAIEARHPKACVLADVFHLHKGGSGIAGLHLLGPEGMHVMHVNDYPAEPDRKTVNDGQRVYPGDGAAPLPEIFRILHRGGFNGYLSLELFNRNYWQQDPFEVARTGLEKTRVLVQASLEG